MSNAMHAMVLHRPADIATQPLRLERVDVPVAGPGEVLIEVRCCGVCHTDLHVVEGELDLPKLPLIPGHQIVGTIAEIGRDVGQHAVGDRVGVTWLYSFDGDCSYCRRGLENLCDRARFTGYDADGGYAEYVVVPARSAYAIPEGFPDAEAAPLLCAGVIGYRSLRLSEVKPGENLGLYGFGASAHVTIQVARDMGCEVYVFTRSEDHRAHALRLGARWVGGAEDEPPERMHASITFAPVGWIVPEALRVLRKGGTLAINAIHLSPIPELDYDLLYQERTVRSVANLTPRDAEELLQLAVSIPIHTDTELYSLVAANEVLKRVKRSEVRGAAVLVVNEDQA